MPQVLTEIVARPPLGGAFLGYIEKLLRNFADSIALTRPDEVDRALHRVPLAMIVLGAAIVRFWTLGDVGLHGDEETMAMAVRGILEQGAPILPSGMFYPRGLSQLALMAVSVSIFGESEWALRLPSALCGVVLVPIGYVLGRRFLRPHWNLAFAASLAFLPELVVYSQTARMYIFLVTCIAASIACVFAWERTSHTRWLVAAAALLVPGIEMHTLAVASMLVFLFPGAVQGDLRKIGAAIAAMVVVAIAFFAIDTFVNAQYPEPPADFVEQLGAAPIGGSAVLHAFDFRVELALILAGIVFAYFGVRTARALGSLSASIVGAVLLLGGLALQLALFYHLAALAYVAGGAVALRYGALERKRDLILFVLGIVVLAVSHVVLIAPSAGTPVRLIGAMIGQPSVWPYVRVAELSAVAGLLCGVALVLGVYRFIVKEKVPEFWLLAVLGVWAPVFALGLFAWNVPSRYTSMSLIPMLVCAFATAQWSIDQIAARVEMRPPGVLHKVVAVLTALCVINPVATADTVNGGYRLHPDHKGAAEFMRTQGIADEDVVMAEDVLQQTYYLGRVDYWLIGPNVARRFVMKSEDRVVDFYTGTPVIMTTAMLDQVLRDNHDKRIFVIGSGEDWRSGRRLVREELEAALQSSRFETVYTGRDGRTRVVRAVPAAKPGADASDPNVIALDRGESATKHADAELQEAAKPATSVESR
jgi:4-amino-4-deoxy-L-arabinose transferase-like glycosyltransferase